RLFNRFFFSNRPGIHTRDDWRTVLNGNRAWRQFSFLLGSAFGASWGGATGRMINELDGNFDACSLRWGHQRRRRIRGPLETVGDRVREHVESGQRRYDHECRPSAGEQVERNREMAS